MPIYTSKGYLLHKGQIVGPGKDLELTNEQAKRLKDKVALKVSEEEEEVEETFEVQSEDETYEVTSTVPNKPLRKYNVDQLKEIAQEYEIEGYSDMKKAELIEAIEARR